MEGKMDFEVPVLSGYLNVPMQSSFSLNRISKKVSGAYQILNQPHSYKVNKF